MDGKVIGRINCTLANWTGLAFKVPRTHLYKCKENGEIVDDTLKKTGYLIGLLMLQVLYWGCKADYAFLLHDLYHLKQYGIMTIVLSHGVLFRGNADGEIRKNLIE